MERPRAAPSTSGTCYRDTFSVKDRDGKPPHLSSAIRMGEGSWGVAGSPGGGELAGVLLGFVAAILKIITMTFKKIKLIRQKLKNC